MGAVEEAGGGLGQSGIWEEGGSGEGEEDVVLSGIGSHFGEWEKGSGTVLECSCRHFCRLNSSLLELRTDAL